eukprot:6087866-Alexandrium_andersonii.AAC.1
MRSSSSRPAALATPALAAVALQRPLPGDAWRGDRSRLAGDAGWEAWSAQLPGLWRSAASGPQARCA